MFSDHFCAWNFINLDFKAQSSASTLVPTIASDEEISEDEVEFIAETDGERRQALLSSEKDDDLTQKLGSENSWTQFENDFNFSAQNTAMGPREMFNDVLDISSDDSDNGELCGFPAASGSTSITKPPPDPSRTDKDKLKAVELKRGLGQKSTGRGSSLNPLGLGNIVQTEINFRKKESLGLAPIRGGGRTLGSKSKSEPVSREEPSTSALEPHVAKLLGEHFWICLVCTL